MKDFYRASELPNLDPAHPRDMEGYVYTDARGWLNAPMDWGAFQTAHERQEPAEELAEMTRAALRESLQVDNGLEF